MPSPIYTISNIKNDSFKYTFGNDILNSYITILGNLIRLIFNVGLPVIEHECYKSFIFQ